MNREMRRDPVPIHSVHTEDHLDRRPSGVLKANMTSDSDNNVVKIGNMILIQKVGDEM